MTVEAGWQDDGSFVPDDVVIADLRAALDEAQRRGDGWREKYNADTNVIASLRAAIRKAAGELDAMATQGLPVAGVADDLRSALAIERGL